MQNVDLLDISIFQVGIYASCSCLCSEKQISKNRPIGETFVQYLYNKANFHFQVLPLLRCKVRKTFQNFLKR